MFSYQCNVEQEIKENKRDEKKHQETKETKQTEAKKRKKHRKGEREREKHKTNRAVYIHLITKYLRGIYIIHAKHIHCMQNCVPPRDIVRMRSFGFVLYNTYFVQELMSINCSQLLII